MVLNSGYRPYSLEVFCGPMKSGKSKSLIDRVDRIQYIEGVDFLLFKPDLDTRDQGIYSRFGKNIQALVVPYNQPELILNRVSDEKVIGIDEAHFFSERILEVVSEITKRGKNLLVSGLDLNFRAEPFGSMDKIMAFATHVYKLSSVCQYNGCGRDATRTQRLINGEPAPYDSPEILVGDEEEGYEPRCILHHFINNKG